MQVFISYSSRNRDLVQELAKDLQGALNTVSPSTQNVVWFDQELVGGQDWWDAILDHLLHCDVFIFSLSPDSIKSDPCNRELTYAYDLQKRILPLWITGEFSAIDLPTVLQKKEWINYTKQDKAAFQGLLTALIGLPPAQPLPDPLPTPPAVPLSPLSEISHQLLADKLDRDVQIAIFYRLKEAVSQPDNAQDARRLLLRLKEHPDVRKSIAEDVDALLNSTPSISAPQPAPAPSAPLPDIAEQPITLPREAVVSPKPAWRKWFGLNGRTIGLVVGIIYGFVLAGQSVCTYDSYLGYTCVSGDYSYLVGSVIVLTGIGWAIDIVVARLKKNRNTTA